MADVEPTDGELLESWRAGDADAGNTLFERHFDALYRFFGRKLNSDVSDLVQRTFLACVEGKERFRGDSSIRTYLYAIARHELYRHYRVLKKDRQLDFGVTSLFDLEPTPSQALLKARQDRLLLEALRHIPLDLQIAVELHYWEGLRGPEIAQVLEIPEGTVRSRLRRGIEQLRQRVNELGGSSEQASTTLTGLEQWADSVREASSG